MSATLETTLTVDEHRSAMDAYISEGKERALALGNRGPLHFDSDGNIHPDIMEAYWRCGFYVLENVIGNSEIELLKRDTQNLIDRAPAYKGATVDKKGRPAFGEEFERDTYTWVVPLSDPVGGTDKNGGRHPSKMEEPAATEDAPNHVLYMMYGMCQAMDSGLRLYGHPDLLQIAETINGPDFTPFNDAIFIKPAGLGGSVAWHQDGLTHWDSPDWDEGIHGFNFQVQLYPSTPNNGLWVMPGTHKQGKVDIKSLVESNGSERLAGAVPLFCNPGDVTITNRQALHCSFANTSDDLRVSLTFGFHRRRSVLGSTGKLGMSSGVIYDEDRVFERSRVIQVAIDARKQFYPEEKSFLYQPFMGKEDDYRWNQISRDEVIKDYNLKDLGI